MVLQVQNIIEKYLATVDNASVLLFGSALDDDWTDKSDIDLFLISNDQKTDVSYEVVEGARLEIQRDNFDQLMEDLEAERGNIRNRNLATMIAGAEVLRSDNDKQIEALKQKAREILGSPTKYDEEDEKAWRESIVDYLSKCEKDLERDDAVAFQIDSTYVVQNLLDLFLAKHNSYLPQPKYLAERLRNLDSRFADTFGEFARANTLPDRLDCLSGLYDIVG